MIGAWICFCNQSDEVTPELLQEAQQQYDRRPKITPYQGANQERSLKSLTPDELRRLGDEVKVFVYQHDKDEDLDPYYETLEGAGYTKGTWDLYYGTLEKGRRAELEEDLAQAYPPGLWIIDASEPKGGGSRSVDKKFYRVPTDQRREIPHPREGAVTEAIVIAVKKHSVASTSIGKLLIQDHDKTLLKKAIAEMVKAGQLDPKDDSISLCDLLLGRL